MTRATPPRPIHRVTAPCRRDGLLGAMLEPIPVPAFALIGKQREISGSPTGSPVDIARMLAFAARHDIRPQIEMFPMSQVNEALKHLGAGKARHRIVLEGGR